MSGSGASGDPLEIGSTVITAYKEQTFSNGPIGGGGYNDFANSPMERNVMIENRKIVSQQYGVLINDAVKAQESDYAAKRELIPADVQKKIQGDKQAKGVNSEDRVASMTSEIASLNQITSQTSLDIISLQVVANSFYKQNFFDRPVNSFIERAAGLISYRIQLPEQSYLDWLASLKAAYEIKRLNDVAEFANKVKLKTEESRVAAEIAAKAAADKAAADAVKKSVDIEVAIKATAAFYTEVAGKFGEKSATLSRNLADSAKGKNIRSAEDAFKAFDKYKNDINKKFSAKDRAAAAKYIDSMDFDAISKAAAKFSRGFGYVGPAMDFKDSIVEFNKSMNSGDWKPFFVKIESVALGVAATALVSAMFGFIAVTPLGIIAFAALISATGAAIDDKLAADLNAFIKAL